MTGTEQTQTQDPLAQFMPQAQPEQPKIQFAGQEFDNLEAAQKWSSEQWERQEREKQQLQAQLQALQAQRQQPAPTQYATGKEAVGYDHAKALEQLAQGPDGLKYMLNYAIAGTPSGVDAVELMKASIAETARLRQQMELLTLQSNHPEIDWRDQNQVAMIRNVLPMANGSAEGAIAILQRDGHLPTRAQWQAKVSQPVAQGNTVQQQTNFQSSGGTQAPPMLGRSTGAAPSSGLDVAAILAKMEDPNTSVEESAKLHSALIQYYEQNPTAGGL